MADITLRTKKDTGVTCISNAFIDNYMKDANGEYVKIYLFLLRLLASDDIAFDLDIIADSLELTGRDVNRAVEYWESKNLLQLEYDKNGNLKGICFLDPGLAEVAICAVPQVTLKQTSTASNIAQPIKMPIQDYDAKPMYSLDEISVYTQDTCIQELLFYIETLTGKPLSPTDLNTVLYWQDTLGFSCELIEYLVEYCVSLNHKAFSYMNKVALNWANKKITTVEAAKEDSKSYSDRYFFVQKALGISNRNLINSETEFVDKWFDDFSFSKDIINEACRRTIANTSKPSFEYTNTVLTNWHNSGVASLSDIEALDMSAKNKFNAQAASVASAGYTGKPRLKKTPSRFEERTYNYDDLEKKLLNQ